jgi:hypothetical protein
MRSRQILTLLTKQWRTLTNAQQLSWNTWAQNHPVIDRFGDPIKLQGNAAFMKVNAFILNCNAMQAGNLTQLALAILVAPPADPTTTPAAVISATAVASTGTINLTFASPVTTGDTYAFSVCRGMSPGAKFATSLFRLVAAGVQPTTAVTVATFVPMTQNARVNFVTGQNVNVLVERLTAQGFTIDTAKFLVTAS